MTFTNSTTTRFCQNSTAGSWQGRKKKTVHARRTFPSLPTETSPAMAMVTMAQAAVRGRHQGYAYINKNPKNLPIRVTHIHLKKPSISPARPHPLTFTHTHGSNSNVRFGWYFFAVLALLFESYVSK